MLDHGERHHGSETGREAEIGDERHFQQTQKLESLGVLAGGVAHDFNNLLAAILGQADLARQELSAPLTRPGENSRNHEASHRAADLCLQMLAYTGKAQTVLKRVDLRALVEEMTHLLKTSISKKAILNLKLEQEIAAPLRPMPARSGRLS